MLILLGYFLCLISLLPLFIAYITKPKKFNTDIPVKLIKTERHNIVPLKARSTINDDEFMRLSSDGVRELVCEETANELGKELSKEIIEKYMKKRFSHDPMIQERIIEVEIDIVDKW